MFDFDSDLDIKLRYLPALIARISRTNAEALVIIDLRSVRPTLSLPGGGSSSRNRLILRIDDPEWSIDPDGLLRFTGRKRSAAPAGGDQTGEATDPEPKPRPRRRKT